MPSDQSNLSFRVGHCHGQLICMNMYITGTKFNFGLILMQDLFISWRYATVGVIALMPVDDYLKSSESLKSALEGSKSRLSLCHEALLCSA